MFTMHRIILAEIFVALLVMAIIWPPGGLGLTIGYVALVGLILVSVAVVYERSSRSTVRRRPR